MLLAVKEGRVFEIVLLIVGLSAGLLGFQLINKIFLREINMSWQMGIAIFDWLTLLVLFVLLSLTVELSRRQLEETRMQRKMFERYMHLRIQKRK